MVRGSHRLKSSHSCLFTMASAAPSPDNVLLSLDVKRKVLSLIGIQGQYTSLRSQYQEEVLELDRKVTPPIFQS